MKKTLQEIPKKIKEIPLVPLTGNSCSIINMKIGDRIREAREKMGLSQSELARKLGVKPPSVQEWEMSETSPRRHRREKLAEILEVTEEWLEFGTTSPELDPLMLAEADSDYRMTERKREIPVVGTTQGGPDRHWEDLGFPPGWGTEYAVIECDDPHAYILRVEGDSMSPRINEGDYVLVEPSTLAQPGDIIVTRLQSGEVMLKYFRADYGEEVALESHNHGFTLRTVPKADIVFIHSISGILFRRKIKKRI